MNIKKEDVVLFFRQNVKSIILAFVCSLVVIIGGLFYFNQSKTEDYSGVSFSNTSNETNIKDEKAEDKHDEKIFVDVKGAQGITGKKVEIYSLPYSSIIMWSTENAGKIFDLNAEVELWTKVGKIKINLKKDIDIRRFDTLLAQYIL